MLMISRVEWAQTRSSRVAPTGIRSGPERNITRRAPEYHDDGNAAMALRCHAQAVRRNVPVTATCLSGAPGHFQTEELSEINDLIILTGPWLLHERSSHVIVHGPGAGHVEGSGHWRIGAIAASPQGTVLLEAHL